MKGAKVRAAVNNLIYLEMFTARDDAFDAQTALLKESLWTIVLQALMKATEQNVPTGAVFDVSIRVTPYDLP